MITFIKINLLFLIFYFCYHFILEPLKLLIWNRIYLILILILSIVVPFIHFKEYKIVEIASFNHEITKNINLAVFQNVSSNLALDYWKYLIYIYIFISIIFIFKLLLGIYKIMNLYVFGKKMLLENVPIIVNQKVTQPFTFVKIFLPEENIKNQSYIIKHEQAHCNQLHFIDALLVNMISCLFWINPILWLIRRKVMLNLEYLADETVIKQIENKKKYQISLIDSFCKDKNQFIPAVNYFNESQILKRIKMMNQETKQTNNWKFFIVIPILVIFMMSFQKEIVTVFKNDPLNKGKLTNVVNNKYEIDQFFFNMNTPMYEIEKNIKYFESKYPIKILNSETIITENRMTQIKYSIKNSHGKKIVGITKCDENSCIDDVFFEFIKNKETKKIYFKLYSSTLNKNKVNQLKHTFEENQNLLKKRKELKNIKINKN